jgi:F-type H+-transporting ATPase subunit b
MIVQIDFFTVIAQILNLALLVLLLRLFLYKWVVKIMDQRERMITARFEEADKKEAEARLEAASYREKEKGLKAEREAILDRTRKEAQALGQELSQRVRLEVDENRVRWYASVEREKDEFLKDLRRRTGEKMVSIIRKALHDLANEDLERRIISTFIERLKNGAGDEIRLIEGSGGEAGKVTDVKIKSSFEVSDDARKRIMEALRDRTGANLAPRFEITPDLIGIELDFKDVRIAWNLKSYLDELSEELFRTIETKTSK